MEENTIKIRKDRIKNIAIVFLAVMLVLTFFSNSILNRALPEVATQMVAYDTITERVRGTGTVTADDPYKVVAKDSRTIESVAVMQGDMVAKDQPLFYLSSEESEELKEKEEEIKDKEDELSKQVLDYMTALLSVDISNEAYLHIEGNNIASVAAYQAQIEASRQKVQSAQDNVDNINRQILIAGMESSDDIDREEEIADATTKRDNAVKRMEEAKAAITNLDTQTASLNEAAAMADTVLQQAIKGYKEVYETVSGQSGVVADWFKADENEHELKLPVDETALQELETALSSDGNGGVDEAGKALYEEFKAAYDTYLNAVSSKNSADAAVKKHAEGYDSAKANAQSALAAAQADYEKYQNEMDKLNKEDVESNGDTKEWQNNLTLSLDSAKAALEDAQAEQEQLLKDISSELALSSQNEDIAETEEELAELREELEEIQAEVNNATILSPVEGTIISVNKTAGESTTPQEELVLIQVTGKGMTVSFSVTNDQAAKVKVGDVAELQNAWYYDDVMVTLSKIRPDTEDPGKRKLLEFNVEGSIQNGDSLTLSVGERSAEYDLVVPNSAIREDKNGKFVFTIEEKSTPFGNRYKAKRVDVEVMASDETKSAISADIDSWAYVITTSNQPIESGDQVRLAGY